MDCLPHQYLIGLFRVVQLVLAEVDRVFFHFAFQEAIHHLYNIPECSHCEIGLHTDWSCLRRTYRACRQGFLHLERAYLLTLVLYIVRLEIIVIAQKKLEHLDDLQPAHNRVSTRNRRHNITCHILDLIKRLLLNRKAFHPQVGHTRYEMDDIVVI